MRRLYVLLLLLSQQTVFALYNGNPSSPMMPESGLFISKEEWFGVKVGYMCDYVFEQSLRVEGRQLKQRQKKSSPYHSLAQFGVMTANFNDRVEVFGSLGALSSEITQHLHSGTKIAYRTSNHFAWGVGGRAILAYWGNVQLGCNASYVGSNPNLSSLKVNSHSSSVKRAELDYNQWQVGIGASYRLRWFIPYVGFDYTNFRMRIENLSAIKFLISDQHITFKDTYPCGAFVGFGLSAHHAISMNVELRLINENAVTVSADFKF
jgi:Chlamydia major outer membrane protein